jgi:PGF-pre-PGF domain-containing protein
MAQNMDVDKILSNPSFRNGVHLLGTFIFGYILLRLFLLFLDATNIGSNWLQTHQGGGLTIIIFILIFSLLVLDLVISMGRRHFNDEKYSIVEVGASYIKEMTEEIKSGSIEQDTGLTKSDVSSLSGMVGTVEKDAFMQKPRMSHISNLSENIDTGVPLIKEKTDEIQSRSIEQDTGLTKSDTSSLSKRIDTGVSFIREKTARFSKPETSLSKTETSSLSEMIGSVDKDDFMKKPRMSNPLLKPFGKELNFDDNKEEPVSTSKLEPISEKPAIDMPLTQPKEQITRPPVIEEFANNKKSVPTETKRIEKPGNQPFISAGPKHSNLKIEKPTRLGDLVSKKLTQEPETNIRYKDVIPIKLIYDRRIIKSIDSQHSINVIDFKSKVNKDDVEIKIELLKRTSRLATPIKSKHKMVYESVNIWVNVSEDDIEEPSIKLKVNRNWVNSNNILTVQLQQYVNGTWNIIPTKRLSQDANNIFYEAFVTKISAPFAIVGTGL